MSLTNNSIESLGLSPEQLTMVEQIKKASADQKEALFNKFTAQIGGATKTKLGALLLGASIAMGTVPTIAAEQPQNTTKVETTTNSIMNNPEYRTMLASIDIEFPRFIEMGKSEVAKKYGKDSEEMSDYIDFIQEIKEDLVKSNVVGDSIEVFVFTDLVSKDSKFYKELVLYVNKFDKYAKIATDEVVAKNNASIKQSEASIKQSEASIKQSEASIKQSEASIEEIKRAQNNLDNINKAFSNN